MKENYISFDYFPNSKNNPFKITSPSSGEYNCIAWAIEDPNYFYWPMPESFFFWPEGILRKETLYAFIQLFESKNYRICENGNLEKGFQKVTLFKKDGKPTHAARQLKSGLWTSKIGGHIDVSHTLEAMEGGLYGNAVVFMRRENSDFSFTKTA